MSRAAHAHGKGVNGEVREGSVGGWVGWGGVKGEVGVLGMLFIWWGMLFIWWKGGREGGWVTGSVCL